MSLGYSQVFSWGIFSHVTPLPRANETIRWMITGDIDTTRVMLVVITCVEVGISTTGISL